MPEGLYFTTVVSSFSFSFFVFSVLYLWGHWTDLNQTWTHSLMTAVWKIWSKFPWAFTPTGWGQKNAFLRPTLYFDRTYLCCNGTWYQQRERNMTVYRDSPTCLQNLVNFGPETAENGWHVFAHPCKFSHWETLPALPHGLYITDSRHVLCSDTSLQSRTTECRAGSCWALPCI